jgi:YggT family protein
MTSLIMILFVVLNILWWIVIIQIVMSWLISFDVLNLRQPFVFQVWSGLNRVLEPLYRPIRNILPSAGGLDFAPLVVLLGIIAIRIIISNNMGGYY